MNQWSFKQSAETAAWRRAGRWVSSDGVRLFVREQGSGQPVLLLHGFPTASYDYARLLPILPANYRCILFDYPGFGFSAKPAHYPYALMRYADAAQQVLASLGLSRIWLVAHDIGASVALELLRRQAPVVERLVLLNTSLISTPIRDPLLLSMQKLLLHPVSGALISRLGILRQATFQHMIAKLFAAPRSQAEIAAFWSLIAANHGQAIYHRLIGYMLERRIHQTRWLAALQRHPAPLTLVWGQRDPVAPPQIAEQIVALRPDTRYVPLAACGHYPHWEAPAAVAAALVGRADSAC